MNRTLKKEISRRWIQLTSFSFVIIGDIFIIFVFNDTQVTEKIFIQTLIFTAIIIQLLDVLRIDRQDRAKRKKFDMERIQQYATNKHLSPHICFMAEYKRNTILRAWDKLTGKTTLAAYKMLDYRMISMTKYRVTSKQLFRLKLKGCHNSDNAESVVKAERLLGIED